MLKRLAKYLGFTSGDGESDVKKIEIHPDITEEQRRDSFRDVVIEQQWYPCQRRALHVNCRCPEVFHVHTTPCTYEQSTQCPWENETNDV